MLKRLNKALPELIAGIVIWGIFAWLAGIWFVKDKLLFTTGLWIGTFLAAGMAIHMAVVIADAADGISGQGKLITMSLLRYGAVVVVFGCVAYFRLGNPIAAFAGVMGLKIAAYLQPITHKLMSKLQRREEYSAQYKSNEEESN